MIAPSVDDELDAVIGEHRDAWLRDAAATLMALDPRAYADGSTLYVLDARNLGAPEAGYLGFTAGAQLHELATDFLPPGDAAAAVAVNVDRIARTIPAGFLPTGAVDTIDVARAAVAAVAAHELAHVLDAQAARHRLPPGATLEQVLRSLADGRATAAAHRKATHSPGWLRAFIHLAVRASSRPHHRVWLGSLVRDVEATLPHDAGTYLDALRDELARYRLDARLVDVLRTPAPAGFLSLFTDNPPGYPRGKE